MQDFNVKLNAQDIYTIKDALKPQMDIWQERIESSNAKGNKGAADVAEMAYSKYKKIWDALDKASLENIGYIIELK